MDDGELYISHHCHRANICYISDGITAGMQTSPGP